MFNVEYYFHRGKKGYKKSTLIFQHYSISCLPSSRRSSPGPGGLRAQLAAGQEVPSPQLAPKRGEELRECGSWPNNRPLATSFLSELQSPHSCLFKKARAPDSIRPCGISL